MVLKLDPVPLAGDPPAAVQLTVYGAVPPVADAVQGIAVPTVPVVGQLRVATSASGMIVIEAELEAVPERESVTATLIVYEPFVLYVVVKLEPVPEAGLPPGAVQANVYGLVPPVAEAVHDTAVPTVPVDGQLIETAST